MLKNILCQSSHKTIFLADRQHSELKSFHLAIALLKADIPKCSEVFVIETELSPVKSGLLNSSLEAEGLRLHNLQVWKESYQSLLDGKPQIDELESILAKVKESQKAGGCTVFLNSITPILFRNSATRVARFISALANLPGVNRLIVSCHSDCHVQEEKSDFALASLQDQVSDVVVSVLSDENGKGEDKNFSNCHVKTTSKSGGKSTVQRVSISVDENFQIQEINRSNKSKPENLAKPETTGSSNADPDKLMQTTFRLGLRISEQEAKNQVVLPFWKKEEGAASIDYTPDEADDWDEEDPDDDLDF